MRPKSKDGTAGLGKIRPKYPSFTADEWHYLLKRGRLPMLIDEMVDESDSAEISPINEVWYVVPNRKMLRDAKRRFQGVKPLRSRIQRKRGRK